MTNRPPSAARLCKEPRQARFLAQSRVARCAVAAMVSLVAASCGSDAGSAPAPTTSSLAVAPEPEQAAPQCWNFTAEELDEGSGLVSTTQSPVDCAGPHNAVTVGTVEAPADQDDLLAGLVEAGQAVGTDDESTRRAVLSPACAPAYAEAFAAAAVEVDAEGVATAYKASTLRGYAWLPTAQQWADGARWIRCDVANRTTEPIAFKTPSLALASIPEDLASCLNADVEGFIPMDCDDPDVNAQALVTIGLEEAATESATADYPSFAADADAMCADAVAAAFPDVAGEGKAALPIAFSFTGQFDCYVDRSADDPLVS